MGTTPRNIAVNPNTNKIYVVNTNSFNRGTVSVIDGNSDELTNTIMLPVNIWNPLNGY